MRVLFVEDESAARTGLSALLGNRGHKTDVAESTSAAEKALATQVYDVVVLDVMLPDENEPEAPASMRVDAGADLLGRLRTGAIPGLKTPPTVPVVAVTAVSRGEIVERLCSHRHVHLAMKPIAPEDVLQVIEAAVPRPHTT